MRSLRWCAALVAVCVAGCVYFNTFFRANQFYKEAEKLRRQSGQEVATGSAASKYEEAIKQASKVLQNHPKSKYADDAIMMIGKSFYYQGNYLRAKEKFVELAGVFRESKLIPESRFYLGMCEYYLDDPDRSREILTEVVKTSKNRDLVDRSRFMLARMAFEEERYADALPELRAYLKTGPSEERALRADSMIAVSYWETEQYDSARAAYGRLARQVSDHPDYAFAALYRRSECTYELGHFESGIEEFEDLAKNDKFYPQRGILEYQVAMGLWAIDSVEAAVEIFHKLPEEHKNSEAAARSLFALGEIYEARGDSLARAQEYFKLISRTWTADADFSAAAVQRSSEIGQRLALQGKLSGADSTRFAESHFLLGELYLRQLQESDSALEEFRLVVDDFAESKYAPLALLNLAEIVNERDQDSVLAKRIWNLLVVRYPGTEASLWARRRLGLPPPKDIAQSDVLLLFGAEHELLEENNPDSALKLYEVLIEKYPYSVHVPKAYYARAWILEHYFPSGDSSVYYAYQLVADRYPSTSYGKAAHAYLNPTTRAARDIAVAQAVAQISDTSYADTSARKVTIARDQDTVRTCPRPIEEGRYEYPVTPPGLNWVNPITVTFMIRINSRGEIDPDIEMVGSSGYPEIDEQARIAALQTRFDPNKLDFILTTNREQYKYEYIIIPPGSSATQFDDVLEARWTPVEEDPFASPFDQQ